MNIRLLIVILITFSHINLFAQKANNSVPLPKKLTASELWADSVYQTLNVEDRIGQLFMVAAYSGGEKYNKELIEQLVAKHHIGGLIFMQGTAEAQAELTNYYQSKANIPLMIGMDAEWGLGMRLKGVQDFPRQIMMGAMQDDAEVYKLGKAVAEQCKRLGVHVNFAPVVDVNNNPDNPVINFRSFGENKIKVAQMGVQYMKGMQDNGVLACAKHFPGHGNTNTDSHLDLPFINSSKQALNQLELFPFRELISKGVGSIMIAHLQVDALDNTKNTPTTLSRKVVTDLLKGEYKYKGLIFTDALNMEGVAKYYAPGDVDLKAFEAGNDVLLFSKDVPTAIKKIKDALNKGIISEERLAESVKKILQAKYILGLHTKSLVKKENATADLNKTVSKLRSSIAKNAITLLNDEGKIISKLPTAKRKVFICFGADTLTTLGTALEQQGYKILNANSYSALAQLRDADAGVVALQGLSPYPGKNFNIPESTISQIQKIGMLNNSVIVVLGNPYAIKNFCKARCIIAAYDDKPETQQAVADALLTNSFKGQLPVSVCERFPEGEGLIFSDTKGGSEGPSTNEVEQDPKVNIGSITGMDINQIVPKEVTCCVSPVTIGADLNKLSKIDELAYDCISKKVFPGCRILIAKEGKIFYDKAFGYTTYDKTIKVDNNTIYDLASVTKVLSTTLAVMRLYERGKIKLEGTLGDYLPFTRGTDKEFIQIKGLLLHNAGLKSWIPFYKETLDSFKARKPEVYSERASSGYSVKVAPNIFMKKAWIDTMWQRILSSELGPRKYEYSDLDFIFLQKIVERVSGKSLDEYVTKEFYAPLGLKTICYNPLSKGRRLNEIAPTELDNYFRYQDVHGYVHDMAAAMFGGVSGHAGLFSNANDISIILQMLLNDGIYKGKRYFNKSTIDLFTSYQSGNSRRGLGWDKPEPSKKNGPTADECSNKTYGHQGFTGTCVWVDPVHNLQFIFLSNRTYPSADNKALTNQNIRSRIQSLAYQSLGIK